MVKRLAVWTAFVAVAGPVYASNPGPIQFPLLGIGQGQTLRINAVAKNPGPVGCDATLSFADRSGNVLTNPGPIQVSLTPGRSAGLDVPSGLAGIGRFEVRPIVAFPPAGGGTNCEFGLEIFDPASGYSTVTVNPGPTQLPAAQPGPSQTFSLMGLGFGQVAQINATGVQPGPIQLSTASAADAGPCVVTLSFVDAAGAPVGTQPGPVQIGPGQTTSHYFLALPPAIGPRVNVRAVVTVDSVIGMPACAGVVSAAETFDLFTGRTWVIANESQPGPVQFPLLRLGRAQSLRLNAVATQPGPIQCDATLSFTDRNGGPIGPAPLNVSLASGHAAFLDIPFSLTGGSGEVRPIATFPAAGSDSACVVGVEVFEQASGYGAVSINPGPVQVPAVQPGPTQTFSLLGLGFGQFAELNATAVNPGPVQTPTAAADDAGPCLVTAGFVDMAGVTVGLTQGPQQLAPGQTLSGYFLALPPIGGRDLVRPVVTVASVAGMPACAGVVSTVETLDVFVGRAWVIAQPGPIQ